MKKLAGALTRGHAASDMNTYTLKKLPRTIPSQPKPFRVVKVAQDVHAHFFVSSVQKESQLPLAPRKSDPATHLTRMEQLVGQAQKVYSCYEAGPTGFALHRQLSELGVENIVVAPTRLDDRGRRLDNDKNDTRQMASKLDRYVAGNKGVFTVVRVPTEAEEQRRGWTRQRKQLQEQRLSLAAQGRSLALTQGQSIGNQWWKPTVWKIYQTSLPGWVVEHLEIFHKIILAVDEEIQKIEARIVAKRRAQAQPQPKWAGDLSMETIEAEVCDWNRITSWRKAGSFAGLTGGISDSGQSHCDLSITKAGNRRLRTALVEMAWRLALNQPDYWLTKKWRPVLEREVKAHPRLRKKAIVAYARALFVDLWKWKTGRITTQRLGWEMV